MKEFQFQTKKEYQEALLALCEPLKPYYSEGKAQLLIGVTGTHYGVKTAGLEGFSRLLWGLVPFWYGGGTSSLDDWIPEGFRNGTNPSHAEYWGTYGDVEQGFVEMAAIALAIWMTPEKLWNPLSAEEKKNAHAWLCQINTHKISDNNWLFFRVLVNCAFRHVGEAYSEEQLQKDLNRIDEFYLGDGWYSDGKTLQRDYYIGFALHFYGLMYAGLAQKEDPARCEIFKERGKAFARDFIYWFGTRGEALPFGRSLTYRFAQVSMFSALAFAGVEAFDWGVIKGIVNRHFRWWFSRPILDGEKKLTLGYGYPNLGFCEGYNAPNSPYWAFKSFAVLALDETHPFWSSTEQPLPALEPLRVQKHPWMVIQRTADGYVTALTSGQYAGWEPAHTAEKYEKFAYSSYFGFQTPRSYYGLEQAAPDNMLAFERDGYYFVRRRCRSHEIKADGTILSVWSPMAGITVETTLTPCGNGHLRQHRITAEFACAAVEGGFSLGYDEPGEVSRECGEGFALARSRKGSSSITLRQGTGVGKVLSCEANVNVLYPRTVLPYLEYAIPAGVTEVTVFVEGSAGDQGDNTIRNV